MDKIDNERSNVYSNAPKFIYVLYSKLYALHVHPHSEYGSVEWSKETDFNRMEETRPRANGIRFGY